MKGEIIFKRWKPEEEYAEDEADIAEEIKLLDERSLFAHLGSVVKYKTTMRQEESLGTPRQCLQNTWTVFVHK